MWAYSKLDVGCGLETDVRYLWVGVEYERGSFAGRRDDGAYPAVGVVGPLNRGARGECRWLWCKCWNYKYVGKFVL